MKLPEAERLREEDPFTGHAVAGVPTHVVACRSRFEFDLNRQPEDAIYTTPEQSWGLDVWHTAPDRGLVARSLDIHAAFYKMMGDLLDDVAMRFDRFILLDVHSYNHRREGPDSDPTPPANAPDINIGTFSMPRDFWASVLDPIIDAMRQFDFNGRKLDVRENVAFQGKGALTRFLHERYPRRGCAIAIEFKKFYMDEWSGAAWPKEVAAMRGFINHTARAARDALA